MRSMLADQPYSEVVSTHGESAILEETMTFSTLSPKTSEGYTNQHYVLCLVKVDSCATHRLRFRGNCFSLARSILAGL